RAALLSFPTRRSSDLRPRIRDRLAHLVLFADAQVRVAAAAPGPCAGAETGREQLRSLAICRAARQGNGAHAALADAGEDRRPFRDRKSTRLNSSHVKI